ncbi:MAG: hypothetical protein A3J48_04355 [Candidatus Doudnabacteria bacterium RIFCSPHIGHO2_02_FULL_46_11]|uniref:glucose-1-phosphate thymidylyltransferase n=1 Tax=Candidatus Doudnabacteria bacterium RIFCSPHIGHO2_02_FULL_46_11 TaxID=1817832 RepID=A0A1F5P4C1_9BACT|nr:MAG: hypothetical protein A3J48_04355 [Candidatus Doudnabacteria bacterium RIFCSPHIGHO2_02_FULL_46_11]
MPENSKKFDNVKGVILAGGNATRLRPLTWVTNKHLLPIYDRPMIYYPLQSLQKAGVRDALISTNPHHAGDFINLLSTGEEFDMRLQYTIQKEPKGMAQVVGMAESFAEGSSVLVLAGDNLFDFDLKPAIERFKAQGSGARIFAMHHDHPEHYGVVEIAEDGKVISVEEKPKQPKSNYIVVGIYLFDSDAFDFVKNLKPSDRGELEITSGLIECYRQRGDLYCEVLDKDDWWIDAGTSYEELFAANEAARKRVLGQNKK